MTYIKWTIIIVFWLLVAAFLHYTLPRNDIVRVTDTYEKRVDFGDNSIFWSHSHSGEAANADNRDVFFIQAMTPNDKPIVYRNEDTGWGWPPYFKFDTSNLQTRANDMKSTQDDPKWVAIKKYGWRLPFLSIYPNAVSIQPVSGPDARIIPWTSIVILFVIACIVVAIWSRWRRFRARRVDPLLDDIEESLDATSQRASGFWRRLGGD